MNRRKFLRNAGASVALATLPLQIGAQEAQQKIASRAVPSTGELLPIIGFGSSPIFNANSFDSAVPMLNVLREYGGKFIDTWPAAQPTLGRYARENSAHDELFLATNLRTETSELDLAAIDEAKKTQGKPVLDMLQLARPDEFNVQWKRMLRWKEEGHAKYIGLAIARNNLYGMVEAAIKNGADFVQLNYSMLEPESGDSVIPMAQESGVAVVANRPFVNGQYFPLVQGKELPDWAAAFDCHSWAQFSLKWILGNPQVTCAITETTKLHHAVDNLSAGLGRLPDQQERARMLALIRSL